MGSSSPSSPGNFSYPPPGSHLHFNYIDSVVTSWLTFDPSATNCSLSVWYWPNTDPWLKGFNQTAPANGTGIVPLDFSSSSYLGELNFQYTKSDGSQETVRGAIFNVDILPQSRAVTWSLDVLTTPTSPSTSTGLRTLISATPSASTATATTSPSVSSWSAISSSLSISKPSSSFAVASFLSISKPSSSSAVASSLSISKSLSASGSHLATSAVVGITLGVVVCAGLAVALIFRRQRKPADSDVVKEVRSSSPATFQIPVPANFIGEKDGYSIRPSELSGNGLIELAARDH